MGQGISILALSKFLTTPYLKRALFYLVTIKGFCEKMEHNIAHRGASRGHSELSNNLGFHGTEEFFPKNASPPTFAARSNDNATFNHKSATQKMRADSYHNPSGVEFETFSGHNVTDHYANMTSVSKHNYKSHSPAYSGMDTHADYPNNEFNRDYNVGNMSMHAKADSNFSAPVLSMGFSAGDAHTQQHMHRGSRQTVPAPAPSPHANTYITSLHTNMNMHNRPHSHTRSKHPVQHRSGVKVSPVGGMVADSSGFLLAHGSSYQYPAQQHQQQFAETVSYEQGVPGAYYPHDEVNQRRYSYNDNTEQGLPTRPTHHAAKSMGPVSYAENNVHSMGGVLLNTPYEYDMRQPSSQRGYAPRNSHNAPRSHAPRGMRSNHNTSNNGMFNQQGGMLPNAIQRFDLCSLEKSSLVDLIGKVTRSILLEAKYTGSVNGRFKNLNNGAVTVPVGVPGLPFEANVQLPPFSLKAVELANALRSKVGADVLAHIRERFGGLLSLLELQPHIFKVFRIPKNDFVALVSSPSGVLEEGTYVRQAEPLAMNATASMASTHPSGMRNKNTAFNERELNTMRAVRAAEVGPDQMSNQPFTREALEAFDSMHISIPTLHQSLSSFSLDSMNSAGKGYEDYDSDYTNNSHSTSTSRASIASSASMHRNNEVNDINAVRGMLKEHAGPMGHSRPSAGHHGHSSASGRYVDQNGFHQDNVWSNQKAPAERFVNYSDLRLNGQMMNHPGSSVSQTTSLQGLPGNALHGSEGKKPNAEHIFHTLQAHHDQREQSEINFTENGECSSNRESSTSEDRTSTSTESSEELTADDLHLPDTMYNLSGLQDFE